MNFQQEIDSGLNEAEGIKDSSTCSRRKNSVWGFGGADIKDCETKNMAKLCPGHRKWFIQT